MPSSTIARRLPGVLVVVAVLIVLAGCAAQTSADAPPDSPPPAPPSPTSPTIPTSPTTPTSPASPPSPTSPASPTNPASSGTPAAPASPKDEGETGVKPSKAEVLDGVRKLVNSQAYSSSEKAERYYGCVVDELYQTLDASQLRRLADGELPHEAMPQLRSAVESCVHKLDKNARNKGDKNKDKKGNG